jgi:hypothetical protein
MRAVLPEFLIVNVGFCYNRWRIVMKPLASVDLFR